MLKNKYPTTNKIKSKFKLKKLFSLSTDNNHY